MLSSLSLCSPREWSLHCSALSGPFATTGIYVYIIYLRGRPPNLENTDSCALPGFFFAYVIVEVDIQWLHLRLSLGDVPESCVLFLARRV